MRWPVRASSSSMPTPRRPLLRPLMGPYSPGRIRNTTASATSVIACLQPSPFYPKYSATRATAPGPSSAASSLTRKTGSPPDSSAVLMSTTPAFTGRRPESAARPPCSAAVEGHLAAALPGGLAALSGLLPVKAGFVDIKTALESGGEPVFRVEDDAADEGPGVVALIMEYLWKKGDGWRQAITEVADAVVLRIRPGEYGPMRGRSNGRLGVGMLEDDTLTGQRIQLRRHTI